MSLGELFEQINEIMGDEAFDKKVFRDIFKVGVNDIKIGVLPPTVDGLIIDNIQGSYSGKVRALVVVGMNEGIIPRDEVTTLLSQALEDLDNHMEEVLKQNSTVGSKMNRLELISNRLADDKINFKDLQSENEDVDEAEAATNLAIQEMVYNAALQTTSKVLQTSLLDFLQ